ncbi:MAG: NAD metabolism ATPase/kinase [Bacteroidetes bacterium GWF2_38_335]|nr:MAG: NAD metabolism ATPase/kinase [Bacteroidetes bacterium GWF2_38_335]OFY81857.1 MAG: NAD metabolism ATPase/kinase [Bacteroidetes bacterium RIFOXYA12_FULL_38_20]HBS87934.1 DUF4301 domain-containing protein [Bacteroidales bacterium]
MFTDKDIKQIQAKGIDVSCVENQLGKFKTGFPFLPVTAPATIGNGIIRLNEDQVKEYGLLYDKEKVQLDPVKFVPASGAATRMFKSLFSYLDDSVLSSDIQEFANKIENFAFYSELKKNAELKSIDISNISNSDILKNVIKTLLNEMEYGSLPKGLLKFHKYNEFSRTSFEEHLVEGFMYSATNNNNLDLHLTVSPEHVSRFEKLFNQIRECYEKEYGIKINFTYSVQKPSTDTIAADEQNLPFRNSDGNLLFRPGGHGALIHNLNDINAGLIFIKNIDNVVPDRLKAITVAYKKAIAGVLIEIRNKIFGFSRTIDKSGFTTKIINEINEFYRKVLFVQIPENRRNDKDFILRMLNRPIRVAGMVKNEGEPGGGPFFARNNDGTISLQIAESSQLDLKNHEIKEMAGKATHFNPVDLVVSTKNHKGEKFDLLKFVDEKTGFITEKSQSGKTLKAQELPGLWNGAMSDWNTIFVEVPLITFNPVKTINDLLRETHQ